MNGLRLAASFLTTLPVLSASYHYEPGHWRAAALWFPIIGLVIGGLVWGVVSAAVLFLSTWLSAAIGVALWVGLTGALHLDGLADCCDGLFAPVDRARRLEILRDPRVGTFGAVGLILVLMLKFVALHDVLIAGWGVMLPVTAALARSAVLWIARQPSARENGLGATFAHYVSGNVLVAASFLPVVGMLLLGWLGVGACAMVAVLAVGITTLARRRLGGITGDVFGLTVEMVELGALLVFAA